MTVNGESVVDVALAHALHAGCMSSEYYWSAIGALRGVVEERDAAIAEVARLKAELEHANKELATMRAESPVDPCVTCHGGPNGGRGSLCSSWPDRGHWHCNDWKKKGGE